MKTAAWLLAIFIFHAIYQVRSGKQKRQIFREQLLPSRGGKIPEEAFRADRLALNRLNKEGISVPDGVVLEARYVQKHPGPASPMPEVLKVYLTPDGRYVPLEGRYNYEHPKSVDTTYLVHRPIGSQTQGKYKHRIGYNSVNQFERYPAGGGYREIKNPTRPLIYKPILAPLIIPTRDELIQKTSYYPSWNPDYSWDLIYEPFDDYFINGIALFNSHQIIADYEGFLNDFHDRTTRHISGDESVAGAAESSENFWSRFKSLSGRKSSSEKTKTTQTNQYTDGVDIPATRFDCSEKIGIFSVVGTKCRGFH